MDEKTGGRGKARHPLARLSLCAVAAVWGLAMAGCKKDCREAVRLGDFEFSQGNYANAAKRYEQALRQDPGCYNADAKLKEARERASMR
jgi:lipopolysaccharide biosynthesis regulator YciM